MGARLTSVVCVSANDYCLRVIVSRGSSTFLPKCRHSVYRSLSGAVQPIIAKHAGRNMKIAHSYQRRRRVHIELR